MTQEEFNKLQNENNQLKVQLQSLASSFHYRSTEIESFKEILAESVQNSVDLRTRVKTLTKANQDLNVQVEALRKSNATLNEQRDVDVKRMTELDTLVAELQKPATREAA